MSMPAPGSNALPTARTHTATSIGMQLDEHAAVHTTDLATRRPSSEPLPPRPPVPHDARDDGTPGRTARAARAPSAARHAPHRMVSLLSPAQPRQQLARRRLLHCQHPRPTPSFAFCARCGVAGGRVCHGDSFAAAAPPQRTQKANFWADTARRPFKFTERQRASHRSDRHSARIPMEARSPRALCVLAEAVCGRSRVLRRWSGMITNEVAAACTTSSGPGPVFSGGFARLPRPRPVAQPLML